MNGRKNINIAELLDELLERVERGEIEVFHRYLYDLEKSEVIFSCPSSAVAFRNY